MDRWFNMFAAGSEFPADAADVLADVGFVVMPGPGALPELVNAYEAVMAAAAGTADHKVGSTTTRLFDLVNRDAAFDAVYIHQPLLEAAARVIRRPFRLSMMLGRTLRPGTAAQELHVDLARDDPVRPMLGFILMIDPFRPENGATRIVPASHRWPEVPAGVMLDPRAAFAGEVLVCGPAGSLLVFDASVWHGHAANISEASRRSIQGYFIPRDAPSGFDLRSRVRPETLARIGPLAKYVLALE
jgi:ectoine hydroxylase-related dioxygenase (phytanoyl-CoA dioxygenase family)